MWQHPEGYNAGAMSLHILALETSANRCGVALLRHEAGETSVVVAEHDGVAEHSARILPMVDSVLARTGIPRTALDAVAFGQGPGGFTGLRVACGVAQGMGFALDIPLLPVGSHAAVECQLPPQAPGVRVIALDARMQEAYVAVFERDTALRVLHAPILIGVQDMQAWLLNSLRQWIGAAPHERLSSGSAVVAGDLFDAQTAPGGALQPLVWPQPLRPAAEPVARLGLQAWQAGVRVDPADARPLYVRDKVAFTTREREGGAGGNPRAGGQP